VGNLELDKTCLLSLGYDLVRKPIQIISKQGDFQKELENVIKDQCEQYDNLAVCLSGGIDSAVIAYYATRYAKKLTAYTMVFNYDGVPVQESKSLVKFLDIPHKIEKKSINRMDIDSALHHILEIYYPFDKGSLIPMYWMFDSLSMENFDGVLFGDGADELFGGYNRHLNFNSFSFHNNIEIFNEEEIETLFHLRVSSKLEKITDDFNRVQTLDDLLNLEFKYEFPNAHLLKMEAFASEFKVNTLFPFLDQNFMNVAMGTNPKISNGVKKEPLFNLFHQMYGAKRTKIPLKFDYLSLLSVSDLTGYKVKDRLKWAYPFERNYNRKIWIAYLLERYEEIHG